MDISKIKELWKLAGLRYKSHPWHGITPGENAPEKVNAFIEIIPTDTVKYEVDKNSGYLMIDRPQKFSNIVPALYGFVPQSYCDKKVAAYCAEKTGRDGIVGDGDPLDILVLTEREVTHGDLIVEAVPIGGFRMIDGGEADDKIVAVLKNDSIYGQFADIADVPEPVVHRLLHYFLTYKEKPGSTDKKEIEITHTYGKAEAQEVIKRSLEDYHDNYGNQDDQMATLLGEIIESAVK